MMEFPWLTFMTFLPLLGVAVILLFTSNEAADGEGLSRSDRNARNVSLLISIAVFLTSLIVLYNFDYAQGGYQLVERSMWVEPLGLEYHLGVDGISLLLVLLTTFLIPFCILVSWESVKKQMRLFMICFLLLETFVIGAFVSLDFVLFYFFFEGSLIPMFLIIGIWGGDRRIYAAYKFFLYTLAGSVLLLLAMIYLASVFGTTSIPDLTAEAGGLPPEVQMWLWLAFFASFAVKVPMVPVHTWLPDAHVQAPTAGSVILAGVLLKLGGYGFLRFCLPMLPDASEFFTPFIYTLSGVAVVYTSLVALVQKDMKKLIAYSSIAHMALVTAGIFAGNAQAIEGAMFQMISHGLVSAALFMCVGVLYDRMHTKEIAAYGGVSAKMPVFAAVYMFFTMASIGLPGTSGFIGEFLTILGVFKDSTWIAAIITTGVVLGAGYMLWLYKKVMFGEIGNEEVGVLADINMREKLMFLPIVMLAILLGVLPGLVLQPLHAAVIRVISGG